MTKFLGIVLTLALIGCCCPIFAQRFIQPRIIRSIASEKYRDKKLERALQRDLDVGSAESVRYRFNRVDLNMDGRPEVIVFLFGDAMCGSGGCDAVVYRRSGKTYKLITHFEPARNPIIVSTTRTHGWNDLIFLNSGGGIAPVYSVCRFDGKAYTDNSTVQTSCAPIKRGSKGFAYVVGPYHNRAGFNLWGR